MTRQQKLLHKARNHPEGLSFEDFSTLLQQSGWTIRGQEGSHVIFKSPNGFRLSIQNRNGKAKGYQVRQFLAQLGKETEND